MEHQPQAGEDTHQPPYERNRSAAYVFSDIGRAHLYTLDGMFNEMPRTIPFRGMRMPLEEYEDLAEELLSFELLYEAEAVRHAFLTRGSYLRVVRVQPHPRQKGYVQLCPLEVPIEDLTRGTRRTPR